MSENANQPLTKADLAAAVEQAVQAIEDTASHPKHCSGWNRRTCGDCGHFQKYGGDEPRGECYRYPSPQPDKTGQRRPVILCSERACGEFTMEAPPTTYSKRNPQTPGHAAKDRR